jgi:membrane fusion protein (multidrug efflux system)
MTPSVGVIVRTEVAGVIARIRFVPGSRVAAGEILIELDRSIEEANLAQARADADLAARTLRRTRELFESGVVAEAALDAADAALAGIEARIASLEATLAKKTIRAPFTGTLGIKQVSVGEYLDPGDEVVSLQALDRVFVELSLPQRDLGRLAPGLAVRARVDAYPGETFVGRLSAINPQVDAASRTLRMQATFDNPDHRLRAGMFANVEVVLPEARTVQVVPKTAVLYASYGDTVFVVGAGDGGSLAVTQQIVRLGETKGDFVEVAEGLAGGERVVTAGGFKLRNGQSVVLSDLGTREPSAAPNPRDS